MISLPAWVMVFANRAQRSVIGLLVLGLLLSACPYGTLVAQSAVKAPQKTTSFRPSERWLLPKHRNRRSLNQIYEFDRTPLGSRMPVILVPGRAEEFQQNSWWKSFNRVSNRNPQYRKHFKSYVFLYNSQEELDVQAEGLDKDIKRRFGKLPPSQPLILVTYSLGGVISREVLKDPQILSQVDTMLALAVPFHGSPIFDPDWFSYYLNPPNRSPVRRFWDRTLYRAYMLSKSNLTRGLKWDNFDSSKPQFQLGSRPVEVQGDQGRSKVPPYVEYPQADAIRSKTIVYASYLANREVQLAEPVMRISRFRMLMEHSILALPKNVLESVLPLYGLSVHSVFAYMNRQMANLPTYTPEDPQGKNTHLYRYNDGAIPLSSMLFLPPSTTPYDQDLLGQVTQSTLRGNRIFMNLDHTQLGEYMWNKRKLVQPDVLQPQVGARSPHQWIVYDLLQRVQEREAEAQPGVKPLPLPPVHFEPPASETTLPPETILPSSAPNPSSMEKETPTAPSVPSPAGCH